MVLAREPIILHRPVGSRGWNYRWGGRALLNAVKQIWSSKASAQERLNAIKQMVADAQRLGLP